MKRLIAICFFAGVLSLPVLAADNAPNVSEQLLAAKRELSELRNRYKDKHPKVQEQLQKIQDLERQAGVQPPESAELRAARTELSQLRQRYDDQLRRVEDLERQAKHQVSESVELRAARAEFAELQQKYKVRHPKYQEALRKVQELERLEHTKK